jgi:hypothetical protein
MRKTRIASRYSRYADTDMQEDAIKLIEKWVRKVGLSIVGGDKIGKYPQTVILDLKYQDGAIRVNENGFEDTDNGFPGVKVYGVQIPSESDFGKFKRVIEENIRTGSSRKAREEYGWGYTMDGWDEDDLDEVGVLDFFNECAKVRYEIQNARRGSYGKFGDSIEDLSDWFDWASKEAEGISRNLMSKVD